MTNKIRASRKVWASVDGYIPGWIRVFGRITAPQVNSKIVYADVMPRQIETEKKTGVVVKIEPIEDGLVLYYVHSA